MERRPNALDAPLPDAWTVGPVPGVQRRDDLILGGVPYRVVHLEPATALAVDELLGGATIAESSARSGVDAGRIARRLVVEGLSAAKPDAAADAFGARDVTVVVPAYNAANDLPALVTSPVATSAAAIVVVDDASTDATADAADALGAQVIRQPDNRGPAAARNAGLHHATTPFVLFVDADATLPDELTSAIAHFTDPTVAVVVPRVGADVSPRPTVVERYEAARSPYDMGPIAGDVGVGRRLDRGASVLLLVRVEAIEAVGGFAEDMRFGEDFDLLRRLGHAGWVVRYEPQWVGSHRARRRLGELLRLHYRYGVPVATLNRRYEEGGGAGTTSLFAWLAAVFATVGLPFEAAAAVVGGLVVTMLAVLRRVPAREVVRVAIRVEVQSLRTVAAALSSVWLLPALALVAVFRTWPGLVFVVAATLFRHLSEWKRSGPALDPVTWTALRVVDDQAAALGRWRGCVQARSVSSMLPHFRSLLGHADLFEVSLDD
ncbi:MAG: mycofactocin glycosyltransferase [Actinomycetota bacterium]|jgi:mycofactocin system glycosyltransferase